MRKQGMELYVQNYSDDLMIILSNKGEVVGIFEDVANSTDDYLECADSIDDGSCCRHNIHYVI